MDLFALIAAFGGGLFGAGLGALPAFILTGFIAAGASIAGLAGAADVSAGAIAFGSYLGPHVAFAGGVAGAAFAANKRKTLTTGGADILTPIYGLMDPASLIVGGVFGFSGYIINYLYGGVLGLKTDTVAMTVFTLGIIARLAFGNTGLTGKFESKSEAREWFPTGNALVQSIVLGLGVGLLVSGVGVSLLSATAPDLVKDNYPAICFGISAISLIFAQTGWGVPTTHHIVLPAASAAVLSGNMYIGVAIGIICSLFGDFIVKTFNSHCDSHIDPPAGTIFVMMFVILGIWG